jgi:hypothetical protein
MFANLEVIMIRSAEKRRKYDEEGATEKEKPESLNIEDSGYKQDDISSGLKEECTNMTVKILT